MICLRQDVATSNTFWKVQHKMIISADVATKMRGEEKLGPFTENESGVAQLVERES